ncbi:MAG: hypothetical protein IID40_04300 [Planctomycetes bacterium]|nr:hypothetical protein [Planctomycetota bacterium]
MRNYCRSMSWVVLAAVCAWPASAARASVFGDVMQGLNFAGFTGSGQSNPLSGGYDGQLGRNFQNTPLDFGPLDLTLTGPVNFQYSINNRLYRSLDFSLNIGTPGNPLVYSYLADVGPQQVRVDGSTVLGVDGTINQFGWYDMRLQFSNRTDGTNSGRFSNTDGSTLDFDIGPIDISGNLYADLLAAITDPIFEASGFENVFASYSGRTARENALESTISSLRAKAAAGQNLTEREVSELVAMAMTAQAHGDDVPSLAFLDNLSLNEPAGPSSSVGQPVPEPATLICLLLPAAWWVVRHRR